MKPALTYWGERIGELRARFPGTMRAFARDLGVSHLAVHKWTASDVEPRLTMSVRISLWTGYTLDHLSVCYRCPTSVVELARTLCPEIEARPGAPEGTVRASTRKAFIADAKEGDMVLCRRNAPLLGMCFALIAEGVSAAVKGRDIASGLVKIVEQVGRKCRRFEDFAGRLVEWGDAKKAAAAKRYKDADKAAEACEIIEDQVECIRVIQDRSGARGPKGLITAIEDLFSDGNASVGAGQ